MKRLKLWFFLFVFFMMIWNLVELKPIQEHISAIKNSTHEQVHSQSLVQKLKDETFKKSLTKEDLILYESIEKEAVQKRIEPIDAKYDPVWKAIPGYNGLEVDIQQTFKYAKKLKGNFSFVYNEISPRISVSDLGPQPIYKGNPKKPMTAFMINVAWGNEFIPTILETLEQENVRASFFLDGSWLKKNVEMAKEILNQGHEISNHAYSHKNMSDLNWKQAKQEIVKTQQLLYDHLGVDNRLFAPPSGDFDEETVKLAHELGLQTVLWTIDTVDWKNPEPSWIVSRVSAHLEPGSMILMHPTASSSAALPQLIKEMKSRGLTVSTVSELLSPERIIEVETKFNF